LQQESNQRLEKRARLGYSVREQETTEITEALLSGQSLLVLGEPGSGKTTLGERVRSRLEANGYTVGMVQYSGSAKDLLVELCEQVGVDIQFDPGNGKPKNKTATQLRGDLLKELIKGERLLIADDAHRWSSSLRYWLEDIWRGGGLLLLLGFNVNPADIFSKLPVFPLKPLDDAQVREILRTEAERQGVKLSLAELARLQASAGNNPAIAKRVVREASLGLAPESGAQHHQYIDGTPILMVLLVMVGIVRLVGLGMGDKSLYVIGGMLTLATIALRAILYAANRGGKRL
jgi:AAA domain